MAAPSILRSVQSFVSERKLGLNGRFPKGNKRLVLVNRVERALNNNEALVSSGQITLELSQ